MKSNFLKLKDHLNQALRSFVSATRWSPFELVAKRLRPKNRSNCWTFRPLSFLRPSTSWGALIGSPQVIPPQKTWVSTGSAGMKWPDRSCMAKSRSEDGTKSFGAENGTPLLSPRADNGNNRCKKTGRKWQKTATGLFSGSIDSLVLGLPPCGGPHQLSK